MRLPHHLHLASNGMYRFRLTVPADLQPVYGKQAIIQSLATRDPSTAKTLAYVLSAKFWAEFQTRRKMKVPSLAEVIEAAKTGRHYELSLPNGTRINVKDQEDHARALEMIGVMEKAGAFKQAPQPVAVSNVQTVAAPLPLSGAIKKYLLSIKDTTIPKTLGIKTKALEEFRTWKKQDCLVHSIDRSDLADYCQYLQNSGIARPTIVNKFSYIKLFFRFCQNKSHYPSGDNPAENQISYSRKEKRKRAKKGAEPFTISELMAIFEPQPYLKLKQPSEYWAPLIGLFTGARVNEICQLRLEDFYKDDDLHCIHITDAGPQQSLKNEASRRNIPIHQTLIDLGLLDYVAEMKAQGYDRLFPNLTQGKNSFGDAQSKAFARLLKRQKVKPLQGRKGSHSFRKTFIQKCQDEKIPPDYRCQFVGHELKDEHFTKYSRNYSQKELVDVVLPVIKFPVPLHQLKVPANRFNRKLRRNFKQKAMASTKAAEQKNRKN